MRKGVSFRWYDLGLELLEQEDQNLDKIEINNQNNVSECCRHMFRLWLRKYSNPTWLDLIQALQKLTSRH